ncbi:competence protein ComGC [Amphibacillus marinus]|uniref:Competence protein ComGC n=1 Tax=Amphibacillus marinus TaxID=872970 RepID=A0A1H8HFT3_9BACI|nr:competence type IV pilus major pilin ComGC [Amphibacillus marinus]SEN54418.1 competence protein ComGC [Amphibacillus marinus]
MKTQQGFTLIEMLIVLAVISILLLLLIPNLAERNNDVQGKGEQAMIQLAESQTQAYFLDNGRYPSSIEELVEKNYLQTNLLANGTKRLIYQDTVTYQVTTEDVN